jgi:hypothetical protein
LTKKIRAHSRRVKALAAVIDSLVDDLLVGGKENMAAIAFSVMLFVIASHREADCEYLLMNSTDQVGSPGEMQVRIGKKVALSLAPETAK